MQHLFSRLALLLLLLTCIHVRSFTQAPLPYPLEPGFQIDSVMATHSNPNRLAFDRVTGHLFYCLPGGDVYEIAHPGGSNPTEALAFTLADHGIQHPQGLHFRDSVLYISGVTNGNPGYTTARISKATLQPNGSRTWATVVQTARYPASLHPFTCVTTDPAGDHLYWASGARTMMGEVRTDGGLHPGRREGPFNTRIFRFPIATTGLTLPNDSALLDASGYTYCRGLRNAYDMEFDAAGELFSIDNSGERDDPEELNWLRAGEHYGFPWRLGDHWNPLIDPNYDVNQDPLVNHLSGGYIEGIFTADPNFPAPPNTVFQDPLRNYGPHAIYARDSVTGSVMNLYDTGGYLRSFTAHRSPLGFTIDRDSLMQGQYRGSAYVLSFMPGGDSTGMSPLAPWGTPGPFVDPCQDLLILNLAWDSGIGEYVMGSRRMIEGFYLPVDAAQDGNLLYVLEQRGGGRANLWRVSFPLASGNAPAVSERPYKLTASPVPTGGPLRLDVQMGSSTALRVRVMDLHGRVAWERADWTVIPGHNVTEVDLSSCAAGMYLVEVSGRQGREAIRVVRE